MNNFSDLSLGYLGQYAQTANRNRALGQQLSGLGNSMLANYAGTTGAQQGAARRAAFFNPNYVDQAGVNAQEGIESAKGSLLRNMGRMGVNPNSGKFQGLMQQVELQGAANKAGAKTAAYRQERADSFNRLMQTANLGDEQLKTGIGLMDRGVGVQAGSGDDLLKAAEAYGSIAAAQEQARIEEENQREVERAAAEEKAAKQAEINQGWLDYYQMMNSPISSIRNTALAGGKYDLRR
jgi:hypothetical protein